ncbi:recombinase family protein, partial [Streptomyces sp. SID7499]|nr:recombinase family protein [Streptomyces sp. SID7499]
TPIMTRTEFDRIGALLASRSIENGERKDTDALLLRVIHCNSCEGRMYMSKPTKNGASVNPFYKCNSHARGDQCALPASIRASWVDEYVEAEFLRVLGPVQTTHVVEIPGYD